jgi:hypothetical protein
MFKETISPYKLFLTIFVIAIFAVIISHDVPRGSISGETLDYSCKSLDDPANQCVQDALEYKRTNLAELEEQLQAREKLDNETADSMCNKEDYEYYIRLNGGNVPESDPTLQTLKSLYEQNCRDAEVYREDASTKRKEYRQTETRIIEDNTNSILELCDCNPSEVEPPSEVAPPDDTDPSEPSGSNPGTPEGGLGTPGEGNPSGENLACTAVPDPNSECYKAIMAEKQARLNELELLLPENKESEINQAKALCTDGVAYYLFLNNNQVSASDPTLEQLKQLDEENCKNSQIQIAQIEAKYQGDLTGAIKKINEETEQKLKGCNCNNAPQEPEEPPLTIEDKCLEPGSLKITSYDPKESYAGDVGTDGRPSYDFYGYELYYPRPERIEITGKCLDELTASSSDLGIDKKQAITVNWTQVSAESSKAHISIYVSQYAKDGEVKIILKNKYDQNKEIILKVNISGTQYLNRKFNSEKIKFYGSWPTINDRVLGLEKETNKIVQILKKPTYANLDINVKIYEEKLWVERVNELAGVYVPNSGITLGFAKPGTNLIYLGEYYGDNKPKNTMPAVFLHEASHQLHFWYDGQNPFAKKKYVGSDNFDIDWWSKIGLSLVSCKYLPMLSPASWVGGDTLPRCGFIYPYGSYELPRTMLAINLLKAYYLATPLLEDVATMNQFWVYVNGDFSKGDAASGKYTQVYKDKINLLKKYGFQ